MTSSSVNAIQSSRRKTAGHSSLPDDCQRLAGPRVMIFRRHFIGMTVSKPPIPTGGAFALTKPSEDYQAQFYGQTLAMAERVPTLHGM